MPPSDFFSDRTTRRQEKRDRVFQQHQSERAKTNNRRPPRRRQSVRPPPPPPTPLPPSPPPSPPPPSTPRTTPTSASGGDEQDLSVSVLGDDEDEPPPPPPQFNNGDAVQGNSLIHFASPSQTLAVHSLGLGLKLLQVGGETDNDRTEFLLSEVKGKDMTALIGSGRENLASVPSGGGGAAAAAAAAEQKKEVKRKFVIRITTGSQGLDELLGGGIETFAIKEAFGGFRSGKTQLAHTCVSTQLPTHMHGGNGKVAYLDTEGTFLPERLVPIAERFGLDPGAIFDNIVDLLIPLFRVDFTGKGELADRQMLSRLIKVAEEFNVQVIANPGGGVFISDSKKPAGGHKLSHAATIRIIFRKGKGKQCVCKVFDAPKLPEVEGEPLYVALFRVDFIGRGEPADRQQKLAQMLSRLRKNAEEFNVAVYMTNQVIADPGGRVFISDPKKPAGGHVLAHAATIRLMFRKGKGKQRVCKVFDAPNLPEAEAVFQITAGGIADAKD